ncbi:UNKNOWN [Stylonychia lemnae]|uniref:Mip family channel protein n=1 Tax=Stylonychia lemnae TaxID=5949 RepID=A0A078AEB1_STYLE|nr:UNKNOWN [Stylonychia lemnae]|eukprot:CDW80176.1 UNKNOWN [Stylonychia lemnae]
MSISIVSVFFLEVFFSMTMMLTILHCKNAKLSLFKDNVPGFLAGQIGIYFGVSCIGKRTGAVMSPNIGFCNVTFVAMVQNRSDVLPYLASYFIGPYCGSLIAGIFVKYVAIPTIRIIEADKELRKLEFQTISTASSLNTIKTEPMKQGKKQYY